MGKINDLSVPGFQYFMSPFLEVISDGKTRHMNEIYELVIKRTNLTEEQCAILLPSKVDTLVRNRIGWVRTDLYKAGLIIQVSRGNYHISPDGIKALKDNPKGFDLKYLRTLPAFQSWLKSFKEDKEESTEIETIIN